MQALVFIEGLQPRHKAAAMDYRNIGNILADIGNQLMKLCDAYDDIDFAFELSAVPDGENDYDFASVNISCVNGEIVDRYCRF